MAHRCEFDVNVTTWGDGGFNRYRSSNCKAELVEEKYDPVYRFTTNDCQGYTAIERLARTESVAREAARRKC